MTTLLLPSGTPSHFTEAEMACPGTGKIKFQPGFLEKLEALRRDYDSPMIITSGCRSNSYNHDLLGRGYPASESSFHLIANAKYKTDTCAVDVARPNGADLHRLLHRILFYKFSAGIAKTFIHLDLRSAYIPLPAIIYTY